MQELANIDWRRTLEHLINFATSTEGKEELKKISPLATKEDAVKSLQTIREAQNILRTGHRPYMESLDLYSSWCSRLEKNAQLKTLELKDIRMFLMETDSLQQVMKPLKGEWISAIRNSLMPAQIPLAMIEQLMTPDGEIRADASEELYRLHNEKKNLVAKVQTTLDQVVKGHEHENSLQDKYVTNREGRWVIPIKSGMRHNLEGIIHAHSSSRQTVFMEPQAIVPLNNRIKELDGEIEQEIQRLLRLVSDRLQEKLAEFMMTRAALLEADITLAKAQFANVTNANTISFANELVDLKELKHPLMVLNGEKVVPNNLELNSKEHILLLSGPNAGGKTVLLKAFGLAAHMARCGLPVCAERNSSLPFFKQLFVAVGDSQSVDQSLSTFAGHLRILNAACAAEGPESLVLIDEICGSTDPDEGTALARSFIDHFATRGTFGLITSHLGPLKTGWKKDSGVVNGSMNYNSETGVATYDFIRGVPGKSLAFATAKKIGVLQSVYESAKTYLSPVGQKRLQALEEIENLKEEITLLKNQLKKEIQQVKRQEQEFENLKSEFAKDKEQRLHKEIQIALQQFKDDLKKDRVKNIFTSHESRATIQMDFPKVVKYTDTTPEPKFADGESFSRAFPPGSVVFVTSLNQDGIIQGKTNPKGEIPILSGSMRLVVHWEDLKPPKKAQNPMKKISQSNGVDVTLEKVKSELDIRGLTVDEAIEKLESSLDKAQVKGTERVKIIHGHGSEALKKAVRTHLSRSVYVSRWQTAPSHEGGDGCTWVFLLSQ